MLIVLTQHKETGRAGKGTNKSSRAIGGDPTKSRREGHMSPGTAILEAEKLEIGLGVAGQPCSLPCPTCQRGLVKETQGPWGLVGQGWEASPRQSS